MSCTSRVGSRNLHLREIKAAAQDVKMLPSKREKEREHHNRDADEEIRLQVYSSVTFTEFI